MAWVVRSWEMLCQMHIALALMNVNSINCQSYSTKVSAISMYGHVLYVIYDLKCWHWSSQLITLLLILDCPIKCNLMQKLLWIFDLILFFSILSVLICCLSINLFTFSQPPCPYLAIPQCCWVHCDIITLRIWLLLTNHFLSYCAFSPRPSLHVHRLFFLKIFLSRLSISKIISVHSNKTENGAAICVFLFHHCIIDVHLSLLRYNKKINNHSVTLQTQVLTQ